MPNKITAYSCAFKCGRRILSNYSGMVAHEARCFDNPAMRACQTCRHFIPGTKGTRDEGGEDWYCAAFEISLSEKGRQFMCVRWQAESTKLKEGSK